MQDPSERRGGVGSVAAGDDAEQMPVAYQLGLSHRDLTIDFQVHKSSSSESLPMNRCPPSEVQREIGF